MDSLELKDKNKYNIYDDIEIIVDPELEDESTIDINNYMQKFILQCRICGNLFPSDEMLDEESTCPICDEQSPNGFIFKGKLKVKNKDDKMSSEEQEAIDELMDNSNNDSDIFEEGDFDKYKKLDLSDNMKEIKL